MKQDANEIIRLSSRQVGSRAVKWIAGGFILGASINFIARLFEGRPMLEILTVSGLLLVMGVLLYSATLMKLSDKARTLTIGTIVSLAIPLITLSFLYCASITVWAFPFFIIILLLVITDRKMFYVISLSIMLTQVTVWILRPQLEVLVNTADHIARLSFFTLALCAALFVNKAFTNKFRENAYHMSKIEELAYQDHLTGLPNRLLFSDHIKQAIESSEQGNSLFAVLYIDLDGFKMINDTMGHESGDRLLQEAAARLRCTLSHDDVIARVGGDEFMIMVQRLDSMDNIHILAQRILNCFSPIFRLNGQDCVISSSMGVAVYPADGDDAETLTKNADTAMYEAKSRGKNQYVLCHSAMKDKAEETVRLTHHLYRALERKELELYYQPQVSCETGHIKGMEALIRWRHPELGMIPPSAFIPIAERTGLIFHIGRWVLYTACRQNKAWQAAGIPPIRVGVNVSVSQLQNPDFVTLVEQVLAETGLSPEYLELEITESIAMKESSIEGTLNRLKQLGVYLSIDDFGTEYSSLMYLKRLNVDRIKIAMPFVQGIEASRKDQAIAKAIIVLGKSMELGVIAEGVETKEQLEFLKREKCDEIQGYYFYRPMPSSEVEELLESRFLHQGLM